MIPSPLEGTTRTMFFTSESVTQGHPDKMADQISDAVLDAILVQDPHARVACEALLKTGLVILGGEITTTAQVSYPEIVRAVVRDVGYTDARWGFDAETCCVLTAIEQQSPEIAMGVDEGESKELGAGDQGMMFGYACDETDSLMPAPIQYAHELTRGLARLRESGSVGYLRPDGKSLVTVEYDEERRVRRIDTIVVSTQHDPDVEQAEIRRDVLEKLIAGTIPAELVDEDTVVHVNPTGRFVIGGPQCDAGLTGRKIIVDTYGGMGRHGGGAFSGKDPTKVDRSAAYMARQVAKTIVAAQLARRCEIQLAYAIGVAEPVSIHVDTFGTGEAPADAIARAVREVFALTPSGIIRELDLRRPIYRKTAAYGHFGRSEPEFTWERTDKAATLRQAVEAAARR